MHLSDRAKRSELKQRSHMGAKLQHVPSILSGALFNSAASRAAERLKGSRFRWINEMLYSITGDEAKAMLDEDPALSNAYHEGFRAQRAKWPRDPLDGIIKWLRSTAPPEAVIGDFGCGEARLAAELASHTVQSFDLTRVNIRVTPCNLAAVPLPNASLDIAIFCLALMGTDWPCFLAEAHRCLRLGGLCHIAEVESRFADIGAVIARIEAIGFRKVLTKPSTFFVELRFAKVGTRCRKNGGDGGDLLQSCIYKRR